MELSFIIAAVRRYFLIIQLGIVAGLVLAFLFSSSQEEVYTARASLLVQPPDSAFARTDNQAAERFLRSQLILIGSSQLAEDVAAKLDGESAPSVRAAVFVEQQVGTDVVVIGATTATPERSQVIANTYVSALLEDQEIRARNRNGPEIQIIDDRIEAINADLTEVRSDLALIPDPTETTAQTVAASLGLGQINQLNTEYTQLLSTRSNLVLTSNLQVQTEIIELANAPLFPDGQSGPLLAIAGAFVGGSLGLAAAVTLASASKRVMDTPQLEELLGANVASQFGFSRRLRDRANAFVEIPDNVSAAIDNICVQAEAAGPDRQTVRIAVVGTQQSSGSTTTALAMAHRFSLQGSEVVLVDVDPIASDMSEMFDAATIGGLGELSATGELDGDQPLDLERYLTPTADQRVRVLGAGAMAKSASVLQRSSVDNLVASSSNIGADMVLFDAGQLQASAASVRLAELVDVVVLAVPVKRQRIEPLTLIRRLLKDARGVVLPITCDARRKSRP